MKQLILLFAGVIIFVAAVGFFTRDLVKKPELTRLMPRKEIKIESATIRAEIADSEEERRKGLSGRESLAENEGMLFIFPQKSSGIAFWMKDMRFPIDIIWIYSSSDGVKDAKVVKIDKNVMPEAGVPDSKLTLYHPDAEVNYVLEVVSGFADKNKIEVGSLIDLSKTAE